MPEITFYKLPFKINVPEIVFYNNLPMVIKTIRYNFAGVYDSFDVMLPCKACLESTADRG